MYQCIGRAQNKRLMFVVYIFAPCVCPNSARVLKWRHNFTTVTHVNPHIVCAEDGCVDNGDIETSTPAADQQNGTNSN